MPMVSAPGSLETSAMTSAAPLPAAGCGRANVEDPGALGLEAAHGLGVRVDGPEFHAAHAGFQHAVHLESS
jgi:hypothetical protein